MEPCERHLSQKTIHVCHYCGKGKRIKGRYPLSVVEVKDEVYCSHCGMTAEAKRVSVKWRPEKNAAHVKRAPTEYRDRQDCALRVKRRWAT